MAPRRVVNSARKIPPPTSLEDEDESCVVSLSSARPLATANFYGSSAPAPLQAARKSVAKAGTRGQAAARKKPDRLDGLPGFGARSGVGKSKSQASVTEVVKPVPSKDKGKSKAPATPTRRARTPDNEEAHGPKTPESSRHTRTRKAVSIFGPSSQEPQTPSKRGRRAGSDVIEEVLSDDELRIVPSPSKRRRESRPVVLVPACPPTDVPTTPSRRTATPRPTLLTPIATPKAQTRILASPTKGALTAILNSETEDEEDEIEMDLPPQRLFIPQVPAQLLGACDSESEDRAERQLQAALSETDEACFSAADAASDFETFVDTYAQEDDFAITSVTSISSHPSSVPIKGKNNEFRAEANKSLVQSLLVHLSRASPLRLVMPPPSSSPLSTQMDVPDGGPAEYEEQKRTLLEAPCLPGLDKYEKEARNVLDRTVREGEGNALILVGGRGSGKSAILSRSLDLLQHPRLHGPGSFMVIRLSGLAQTTDRLALRAMARQLCQGGFGNAAHLLEGTEVAEHQTTQGVEDDGSSFTNHANTLASLLSLLEPRAPEGQVEEEGDQSEAKGERKAKPLIIILDEFDLFADRPRQSFLYCLLDVVQGAKRKGGIAVVGLSAAVSCLEKLEKRVKSRCQSRVQYIIPPGRNAASRTDVLRAVLRLTSPRHGAAVREDELERAAFVEAWNRGVEEFANDKRTQAWMEAIWELQAEWVPKLLEGLYKVVLPLVERWTESSPIRFPFLEANSLALPSRPPRRMFFGTLGTVELSVLVSAKHLSAKDPAFNLEMCWDEYRKHSKRVKATGGLVTQVYSRDVFAGVWDSLRSREILIPFTLTARAAQHAAGGTFRMYKLVPWPSHLEAEIESRPEVPRHLKAWSKNFAD